jgi:hypothetical protein
MNLMLRAAFAAAVFMAPMTALATPAADPAPISVMIVGGFHMSNPGRDLHNMTVDDMLSPKRQAQIAAVTDGLNRFHPTVVAVEWPADIVATRYEQYLAGTLKPSTNEVVQLGFRLAHSAGLKHVNGIDADGDFPFDAVQAYAKAHGQSALVDKAQADIEAQVQEGDRIIRSGSVSAMLRHLNEPAAVAASNGFYRNMLKVGGGTEQPGADLLTAWYHRNFLICANLLQLAKPGDHVVIFYGSGHGLLLRQCVRETPGYRLVEPNAYLPK